MSVVLQPGQRICSHVRIVKPAPPDAGSRLFGDVWMAADDESGGQLWLTVVGEEFLPSIFEFSEFMAKANGLSRLRHPDLVRVALVDREEKYCVIGYEALDGANLFSELLLREKLDAEKVLRRSLQLAKGLAYLHSRGVMHGLLSAATTFEWEGQTLAWQYGLVQAIDSAALAEHCRRASDDELFPPELHRGSASPATDVWAWAALVAEMASGLSTLEAINETLDGGQGFEADPRLVEVLQQCLAADPAARLSDANQIVERLELIKRGGAVVGMPGSLAPPPPPKAATGAIPALEAGLPDSSDSFEALELDDADIVESGGHRIRRNRPGDSTAGLRALAKDELGDSMTAALDKVLESGSNLSFDEVMEQSDPHLVELAQEAAMKARVGAPRGLDAGLPAGVPSPAPRVATGRVGGDEGVDEAIPVDKKKFELPRRPGPHGPPPRPMAVVLLGLTAGLVGLSFMHVANERGGAGKLFGVESKAPPAVAGGTEGAETEGPVVDTDGAPALPEPSEPDLATPPAACAAGMAAINDDFCIDTGEFPGAKRIPQVDLKHRQAALLCENRGHRLCSFDEWKLACRGAEGRKVPYGKTPKAEMCNTASIAGFPQETGASASYRNCVTPEGVYDLVGNVGEWVAEGFAVGGDSTTDMRQATCTAKGRPPKGYQGADLGFRCCMDR